MIRWNTHHEKVHRTRASARSLAFLCRHSRWTWAFFSFFAHFWGCGLFYTKHTPGMSILSLLTSQKKLPHYQIFRNWQKNQIHLWEESIEQSKMNSRMSSTWKNLARIRFFLFVHITRMIETFKKLEVESNASEVQRKKIESYCL